METESTITLDDVQTTESALACIYTVTTASELSSTYRNRITEKRATACYNDNLFKQTSNTAMALMANKHLCEDSKLTNKERKRLE